MKKRTFAALFFAALFLAACDWKNPFSSEEATSPESPNLSQSSAEEADASGLEKRTEEEEERMVAAAEGKFGAEIRSLDGFYYTDGKQVYFAYSSMGADDELRLVDGADAGTFEVIEMDGDDSWIRFGKDANYVYSDGERIEGVSGEDFEFLADPNGTPLYAKDANSVYMLYDDLMGGAGSLTHFIELEEADPATFEFFDHENRNSVNARYAHDDKQAYFGSKLIAGADGETFEHVQYSVAKDGENVYFLGEKVEGADPDSIEYAPGSCDTCYKDKNAVFECFNTCKIRE